jgi:predicted carbohydrate-binding protein with CBM5 and CBM33 domain
MKKLFNWFKPSFFYLGKLMKTFILLTTLFFSTQTFAWSEAEEESLQQLQQIARDTAVINEMRNQERQHTLDTQELIRQERVNNYRTNAILLDNQYNQYNNQYRR